MWKWNYVNTSAAQGSFADSVDQDQTAQTVKSDLGFALLDNHRDTTPVAAREIEKFVVCKSGFNFDRSETLLPAKRFKYKMRKLDFVYYYTDCTYNRLRWYKLSGSFSERLVYDKQCSSSEDLFVGRFQFSNYL